MICILGMHNRFMIGCIMLHGPTSYVFREDVNGLGVSPISTGNLCEPSVLRRKAVHECSFTILSAFKVSFAHKR